MNWLVMFQAHVWFWFGKLSNKLVWSFRVLAGHRRVMEEFNPARHNIIEWLND